MKRLLMSLAVVAATRFAVSADVLSASLNELDLDSDPQVVTNVSLEGLVSSDRVRVEPIKLSPENIAAGNKFVDAYGEDQNSAIEIGDNAKARVDPSSVEGRTNVIIRSVSIAIGANADASMLSSKDRSQAIAIGWHAQARGSNAIAIGNGAQHKNEAPVLSMTNETQKTVGDATVALQDRSIAIGYSAKATASQAVQIGQGVNDDSRSLQFLEYKLLDGKGQIPAERMTSALAGMSGGLLSQFERVLKPGNMHIVAEGLDEGLVIEPRLNGLSELTISPASNGVYMAGNEIEVAPPLGSRNYEILVEAIPRFTNGAAYALADNANMIVSLAELDEPREVTILCDPSVGYALSKYDAALTNAPLVIKVSEVSTNRVICMISSYGVYGSATSLASGMQDAASVLDGVVGPTSSEVKAMSEIESANDELKSVIGE